MKRVSFILILILPLGAFAQTMHIKLADGRDLPYSIDSVQKLTFRGDTANIEQYQMRINPNGDFINVGTADSVTFGLDSSERVCIYFFVPVFDLPGLQRFQTALSSIDSLDVKKRFVRLDTNSNVIALPRELNVNGATGDFYFSIWINNRIYNSSPLHYYELDSSLGVLHDSSYFPLGFAMMDYNNSKHTLLGTGISGNLLEFDVDSSRRYILDSSVLFSNAVYLQLSTDIIYYTFANYSISNQAPDDAGFYLWNRRQNTKQLLLHYLPAGFSPVHNVVGFDLSPGGEALVFGVESKQIEPIVVAYSLISRTLDTLPIKFDSTEFGVRPHLWVRFSHDGTRLLYCNYPADAFPSGQPDNYSEIGIIDLKSMKKQILHTNPVNVFVGVSLFPEWSPDDSMIVYGNVKLDNAGSVGPTYGTCILTDLQP